jgi:anti-sigma regulatory factor (Ser/Thr protein kinase)
VGVEVLVIGTVVRGAAGLARMSGGYPNRVSVADPGRLFERLPACPQSIGPLRRAVVQFASGCGASDRQCEDIAVAVSEAMNNVVEHAYVGRETPGIVAVEASGHGSVLVVVVCDEGIGIRARDIRGVGIGLQLIFRLTERVEFVDTMAGARVSMTFRIG